MTRVILAIPMTCHEIRQKVAAWVELFGAPPLITIRGSWYTDEGEIVFPAGSIVTRVSRKYIVARLDGKEMRLDPTRCAPPTRCYIILEETEEH